MEGHPSTDRVIRVFVSSTFRDMQEEREELTKRVFPQLRKLCESRGVTWGEVDLRWGVTDEQKAEGKVLPICLAEIERSRPYFIGLLGERYGWVPDEIDAALIEQEPWLSEHLGKSVTELEILHGVLNDPEMAEHAFFYLRDPAYTDGRPPEQFQEGATLDEIAELGVEEAESRAEQHRAKLESLKQRIRDSGLPVHEDYPDPRALGELVLAELTAVIDRLYPKGSEPDSLDKEASEHEAFARSRAGVYIGRREYAERLDAHARGDGPPLTVLGKSGSGKSALLANWALSYREQHPEELVLTHFIGASPASSDWQAMLRRIMGELDRRVELGLEIPDSPDQLRPAFANALHMAAARGRVVLVLDALNQLEDREGAPDLVWLSPEIPANVRLVVSTLPGRPLDELSKRGGPMLEVEPLSVPERERLIVEYLAQYTKALDSARARRIAGAEQAANPLFLRTLLDELRLWGEHETLDRAIDGYLEARDPAELYVKILERYENDYERDREGLVRDAMTLIWAARRGLSEAELLDLLGSGGDPLPRALWSPLYLAAEQALVSRRSLLGFAHDYLRRAVQTRYVGSREIQQAAHLALAGYFESRDLDPRKIDELPWQLAESGAWQRLFDLLADLLFLRTAWKVNQFEIKAFWAQVEAGSPLRIVDAYRPLLDAPESQSDPAVWTVAALLNYTGHPEQALSLLSYLVDRYRETGDRSGLQASLGDRATILFTRGDLDGAMHLYKEQERICRELGDLMSLQRSLGNQGLALRERGDLEGAMALHNEEEQICRQLGDFAGLQVTLGNKALILQTRGDFDGAMALHKEEERICRELGNPDSLQRSLGNQAIILQTRGDLDGAMALLGEKERICRELGNPRGIASSLQNQALVLEARGDLGAAVARLSEAEWICRELGDPDGLQRALGEQGLILRAQGDLGGALRLLEEQERICRELGSLNSLQRSLGNQAIIHAAYGDLRRAMPLLEEQEQICRDIGNPMGVQASIGNQGAVLLQAGGDPDRALALLEKQERICRELGNRADLKRALGNRALIYRSRGDDGKAMELMKEEEQIARELDEPEGLAMSLVNQALLLSELGRSQEARSCVEEAYGLALENSLSSLVEQIRSIFGSLL
jgi:tetratricopeptide (TPR) repeat protein